MDFIEKEKTYKIVEYNFNLLIIIIYKSKDF